jgi:hypothetical protein
MNKLKKTEGMLKAFLSSIVPCTTEDDFRVDESFLQFPKDPSTKETTEEVNLTMIGNIINTLSTPLGNTVCLQQMCFFMFQKVKKTTKGEDLQQIEMGEWAEAEIDGPVADQEDWSEENQAAYEENQAPIAREASTWSLMNFLYFFYIL